MIARNCDGRVPEPGELAEADRALLALADALPGKARAGIKDFALHLVLADIWAVVAEANRYFASQEPWILRKRDPVRMGTVLWVTAEALRAIAILAQPFVPAAAGKLLGLLAVPEGERLIARVGESHRLAPGTPLPKPEPIFPRYVEAEG
jgi:methionyl-tRNA synthetase